MGLLSDHSLTFYFLNFILPIGDDPVTAQKLCWNTALVAEGDRIRKYIAKDGRVGLLGNVGRLNFDLDSKFQFDTCLNCDP